MLSIQDIEEYVTNLRDELIVHVEGSDVEFPTIFDVFRPIVPTALIGSGAYGRVVETSVGHATKFMVVNASMKSRQRQTESIEDQIQEVVINDVFYRTLLLGQRSPHILEMENWQFLQITEDTLNHPVLKGLAFLEEDGARLLSYTTERCLYNLSMASIDSFLHIKTILYSLLYTLFCSSVFHFEHRDLKPENLLFQEVNSPSTIYVYRIPGQSDAYICPATDSKSCILKLCDFSISKCTFGSTGNFFFF